MFLSYFHSQINLKFPTNKQIFVALSVCLCVHGVIWTGQQISCPILNPCFDFSLVAIESGGKLYLLTQSQLKKNHSIFDNNFNIVHWMACRNDMNHALISKLRMQVSKEVKSCEVYKVE